MTLVCCKLPQLRWKPLFLSLAVSGVLLTSYPTVYVAIFVKDHNVKNLSRPASKWKICNHDTWLIRTFLIFVIWSLTDQNKPDNCHVTSELPWLDLSQAVELNRQEMRFPVLSNVVKLSGFAFATETSTEPLLLVITCHIQSNKRPKYL